MANHIYPCAYIALVSQQAALGGFGQGNWLQWPCSIDTAERSVSGF